MPCCPAAEVDRAAASWLPAASPARAPMSRELEPQVLIQGCAESQGHYPSVCLVERLEARSCQALKGGKRANIGRTSCICTQKKKGEKKAFRTMVLNQEWFCHPRKMSRDIFGCHYWRRTTGIQWVEASEAVAKHPIRYRTPAHNKGLPCLRCQ